MGCNLPQITMHVYSYKSKNDCFSLPGFHAIIRGKCLQIELMALPGTGSGCRTGSSLKDVQWEEKVIREGGNDGR